MMWPSPGPGRAAAISYLLRESFEGTGFENAGWTAIGNADPDYTGTVLEGSHSFRSNPATSDGYARHDITSSTELWAYFLFRRSVNTAPQWIFRYYDSTGSNPQLSFYFDSSLKLNVRDDVGGQSATTVDAISLNTTYSVWMHWIKGTGANSVGDVEFATTPTKVGSGNKFASYSNGHSATAVNRIYLGDNSAIGITDSVYDHLRVNNVAIGSSPI